MTVPDGNAAETYPLFLRLADRPVLVVGGGPVAVQKAMALQAAGARVRVVAPVVDPRLAAAAGSVERRAFAPGDLDGVWLAVAAAPPAVNRAVREAGDARRVFVVAVDDVESCSAFGAARLRRAGLTVAISSDGRAPGLVALLRQALEALLPDDAEAWVDVARRARSGWKATGTPLGERRPLLLSALNALYARAESS